MQLTHVAFFSRFRLRETCVHKLLQIKIGLTLASYDQFATILSSAQTGKANHNPDLPQFVYENF